VQVRDEFRDDFDPGRGGNPMNQVYLEGMGQWPGPHEKRRRGSDLQALGQPPQQRRREGTGRGPYSHGQQASVQPQVGTNSEQYGMPGQGRGVRQQVFGDPVEGFERLKEAGPAGEEGHNGGPAFGDFGGVPAPGQQEGLPGPPPNSQEGLGVVQRGISPLLRLRPHHRSGRRRSSRRHRRVHQEVAQRLMAMSVAWRQRMPSRFSTCKSWQPLTTQLVFPGTVTG
jgi:hypothetical protein